VAVKAGAFGLLSLLLLEPTVVRRTVRPGLNDFLVLVDNGGGMAVHGGKDTPGRIAAARDDPASWFGRLAEWFRVETYRFDTGLAKIGKAEDLDLAGLRSDLGGALDTIRQRYARRPLAGILLVTDGNATDRDRLAQVVPGVPVFPVVAGDAPSGADLAVGDVAVTESGFEDAPVTVSVQARAWGMAGRTCRVAVQDAAGKELAAESVPVTRDDQPISARLRFRGALRGITPCAVVVRPEDGDPAAIEITDRNNRREFVVDHGRGDYRILYVAGRPNWEYKFLRRALDRDDEIQLVGLLRLAKREPKFQWRGRAGETSNPLFRGFQGQGEGTGEATYDKPVLIRLGTEDAAELRDGFPRDEESLFPRYDALVLDDLEAGFFSADQQELVEEFVSRRGGAMLMLGGQESFREGDHARTPLGRMLPVALGDAPAGGQGSGPVSLRLSREGWLEPWMRLRLTEADEETRLAGMPPFASLNRTGGVKPGATLLAAGWDSSGAEAPAVATHTYGQGRVGAILVGDVWRWGMEDAAARRDMETWWRQVIRWLVADVPDFVRVATDWAGAETPGTRNIEVRLRDPGWRPLENATVELEVSPAGNGTEDAPAKIFAEPSLEEAGLFTATFACPAPGAWRIRAVARGEDGTELGTAEAGWAWTPAAEEYASLVPDRAALEDLARRTGGRVLTWDGLGAFAREASRMNVPLAETASEPAWHRPWWLLLAVALFSAEWGIRRWKGLA
jgi:hypothetical protein